MDNAVSIAIKTDNAELFRSLVPETNRSPEVQSCLQNILLDISINGTTSVRCLDLLLDYADINLGNPQQRTALHFSAFHGHLLVVQLLLKRANIINIDQKTQTGCTATYFAACKGFKDILELLLRAGSNPNISTQSKSTPLIAASLNGHYDAVELLLIHNAEPNVRNSIGMTAIHAAALNGNLEIMQLLQKYGADPQALDNENRTPSEILQSRLTLNRTPTNMQQAHNKLSSNTCESNEDTTAAGSNSTGFAIHQSKTTNSKSNIKLQTDQSADTSYFETAPKSSSWRCTNFKALLCNSTLNNELNTSLTAPM